MQVEMPSAILLKIYMYDMHSGYKKCLGPSNIIRLIRGLIGIGNEIEGLIFNKWNRISYGQMPDKEMLKLFIFLLYSWSKNCFYKVCSSIELNH